ncbi:MAG: HlyC/CorC family transporter [Acidobacteria bacterium]|nr:HlyC/CorC family transporter [Acidobacteriota bacterium]
MTPLLLFLLAVASVYVGTITSAFSALMQLSLRIMAEGSGRDDRLTHYLDHPQRLFVPARLLKGVMTVATTVLIAGFTGVGPAGVPVLLVAVLVFLLVTEHLVPLLLVRHDPEQVLSLLLPSFDAVCLVLAPITTPLLRVGRTRRGPTGGTNDNPTDEAGAVAVTLTEAGAPAVLQEGQAREMLRSLVDFRETMVREVMTPRPDIVAVPASATVGQLQALFRDQQYSRMPVYQNTLDNVTGFVFVKDLIHLATAADPSAAITTLIRAADHANFVPETKRVPELLREFQRNRLQMAIVVDEYGGIAGLVTIEDLLEEIVGEIRDEYDTEVEPVVDEGDGRWVFSGKAHVEELRDRVGLELDGEGFETVGGYLLSRLGRVPAVGEHLELDGLHVDVLEAERRRIIRVRVTRPAEIAVDTAEAAG